MTQPGPRLAVGAAWQGLLCFACLGKKAGRNIPSHPIRPKKREKERERDPIASLRAFVQVTRHKRTDKEAGKTMGRKEMVTSTGRKKEEICSRTYIRTPKWRKNKPTRPSFLMAFKSEAEEEEEEEFLHSV